MILSIQSDVLFGAVGQKAAMPIYQAALLDATQLATIVLAAHPGFGVESRAIMPANILSGLLDDFLLLDARPQLTALHIGYFGAADQVRAAAEFIEKARRHNPALKILLDPVFGDGDRRYVADEIIEAVIALLVPQANIITPNHFELSLLAGTKIESTDAAIEALTSLNQRHQLIACVTGLAVEDDKVIYDLMVKDEASYGEAHKKLDHGVSGAGDAFSALLLSVLLHDKSLPEALSFASAITQHMIAQSKSPLTLNVASGLSMIDEKITIGA